MMKQIQSRTERGRVKSSSSGGISYKSSRECEHNHEVPLSFPERKPGGCMIAKRITKVRVGAEQKIDILVELG